MVLTDWSDEWAQGKNSNFIITANAKIANNI
jgi:hypothetical protein